MTNEDLSSYFGQYGEVAQAQVKFDRATGRSRGFAFVEFATADACKSALAQREQQIKNKQVEVKPAKSRENKKVFVGGLPSDFSGKSLERVASDQVKTLTRYTGCLQKRSYAHTSKNSARWKTSSGRSTSRPRPAATSHSSSSRRKRPRIAPLRLQNRSSAFARCAGY